MDLPEQELVMINGSLQIMSKMYNTLRELNPVEAIKHVSELNSKLQRMYSRKDGKDTLLIDIAAEQVLALGSTGLNGTQGHLSLFVQAYDEHGVFITEERGKYGRQGIKASTPVIISDPIDQSSGLVEIANRHFEFSSMGEVFDAELEQRTSYDARTNAPNSSVTFLQGNDIKYTLVLNLLTGLVYVGFEGGVFAAPILEVNSVDELTEEVKFRSAFDIGADAAYNDLRMVCYAEGDKYVRNLIGTDLNAFLASDIEKPVGPLRFAYLIDDPTIDDSIKIGVVAHNGEKVQESLPNIAIAMYADSLEAYKLFCPPNFATHRAGQLLTPTLNNSLFSGQIKYQHGININHLNDYQYPSQFRDTTVIIPRVNRAAKLMAEGMVATGIAIRIV